MRILISSWRLPSLLIALIGLATQALGQTPEWIWFQKTSGAETRYFRKTFEIKTPVTRADLTATGDDSVEVYVNGEKVLSNGTWSQPATARVEAKLKPGANTLAMKGGNGDSSAAGLLLRLDITGSSGKTIVISDGSWKASAKEEADWAKPAYADAGWAAAQSLGKHGMDPWGQILGPGGAAPKREATPAEDLYAAPGFKVERIRSAETGEGSWVAMTKDDKGRLIVSPQHAKGAEGDGGLMRLTLDAKGQVTKREFIAKPLFDAQGLLYANKSIYVVVNKYSSKYESGLYRVRDTEGNDQYGNIQLLKAIKGGGEHGPHAVEMGPDGKIYVMGGNHTPLPEGIAPNSPHRNYQEDHLLPRQWDGNGHAAGILAPGGWIARTDADGKSWDLFCAGFRNQYDFAFNVDGELFTYDSDMEWDWGMPWYRPTRVNHCVSGGEFGWRSGTGKWPDYYPDSLPAFDIGVGCPTGVATGRGAKFPAKYQRALYIMDWTYGRLMAVHQTPNGSSYSSTFENFVCPAGLMDPKAPKKPLNLTDMVVGNDGALYFTTGGRGVQSGLYRVTYAGPESTAHANHPNKEGAKARALRHELESFHGKADPKAVNFLWPHLDSPDRYLRYAARVALEWQPVESWKDKALSESRPEAALTALLALARVGGPSTQADLLKALGKFPLPSLSEAQQLEKLRVIGLSFVRQGRPTGELAAMAIEKLSARFPSSSPVINRELAQLLIFLDAPGVVGKTLQLMAKADSQEEMIHYLFHLRTAKTWTLAERREYFAYYTKDRSVYAKHQGRTVNWFQEAGRDYGDGASFANFMKNFFNEAVKNISPDQLAELQPMLAEVDPSKNKAGNNNAANRFPAPKQRKMVREWKMAEVSVDNAPATGRNFEKGRQAFVDAQCLACHRFGNEGGGVGPDLTAVATRFSRRDILESILDPSKVVSEQFQNTTVELRDGEDVTGRLVAETQSELTLVPDQLHPEKKVVIDKSKIKSKAFSKVSPMPEGLANILEKDEILDLLAFLESAGRRSHPAFKK